MRRLGLLCEVSGTNPPRALTKNLWLKLASVVFGALIWFISFGVAGTTVRNLAVPVEFTNVPSGLRISQLSADSIQVQLRGSSWMFEAVNLSKMSARADLRGAKEGAFKVALRPDLLNPPPGIRVERISPLSVSVVLSRH